MRWFPIAASFTGIALVVMPLNGAADWQTITVGAIGVAISAYLLIRDQLRKTVVVFYEFESGA